MLSLHGDDGPMPPKTKLALTQVVFKWVYGPGALTKVTRGLSIHDHKQLIL